MYENSWDCVLNCILENDIKKRIYARCLPNNSLVHSSNKISANTRGIICRDIWDLWNGIPDFCNFAAFRKVPRTSASMFEHVHVALQLHRSRMVADQMYAAGLAFARLHLILAKKSFELLGDIGDTRVIKEKHPSCFETLNIRIFYQVEEATLDHQTQDPCHLVKSDQVKIFN